MKNMHDRNVNIWQRACRSFGFVPISYSENWLKFPVLSNSVLINSYQTKLLYSAELVQNILEYCSWDICSETKVLWHIKSWHKCLRSLHKITQMSRMWVCNNYFFPPFFWWWKPVLFSLACNQVPSLKPFMFRPNQFSLFPPLTNGCHECLQNWEEGPAPSQARLTCFLSRKLPIRKGRSSFNGALHLSLMHTSKLFIPDTWVREIVDLSPCNRRLQAHHA